MSLQAVFTAGRRMLQTAPSILTSNSEDLLKMACQQTEPRQRCQGENRQAGSAIAQRL